MGVCVYIYIYVNRERVRGCEGVLFATPCFATLRFASNVVRQHSDAMCHLDGPLAERAHARTDRQTDR